jgi:UDP-2,3-diacylglucosamine pyrophosphatase LpxH
MTVLRFRTIVLSDVHLGSPECKIDEVNRFLKHTWCEKLILNGDIIDGWSLMRRGGWKKSHTRFVRHVLKKVDKKRTEVVYLRGNHDDALARFIPVRLGKLKIVEEHVHEGPAGRYLVVHGDVFDAITRHHRFLAILGDVGYQTLLKINRIYNRYRTWRGRPYFSLSRAIKARVKQAVSYVSRYEAQLQDLARRRDCVGIICGHIHTPDDKRVGEIHYLNSGDWVESRTAIVEHFDGTFEILTYPEFLRRLEQKRTLQKSSMPVPVPADVEAVAPA